MSNTEVKVVATVYGGREIEFTAEDIGEMLGNREMYAAADSLPKWMRFHGGFSSFEAVWEAIENFAASDEVTKINVRSDK